MTLLPTLKVLDVKNLGLCTFLPQFQELPLPVLSNFWEGHNAGGRDSF